MGKQVSALVDRALEAAGLLDVASAREEGRLDAVRGARSRLEMADLLALGALADRVRAREVGDVVRVYANVAPGAANGADVVMVHAQPEGLAFLRATAIARITGPFAARVRVDWTSVGLELAQVALGFGASELLGIIATKRGLPLAEGDMSGSGKKSAQVSSQVVKQRELEGFIERSGRRALFVQRAAASLELESEATT